MRSPRFALYRCPRGSRTRAEKAYIAHGEAQLRQRWGYDGARVIADTSGAKIWLPGITDPDALETASMLCGTAAMREHGETWTSRHPIMTPDMIRQLPASRALVIRGGYSPVIAKLRMAWHDPLYRHARQLRQETADVIPLPDLPNGPPPGPWPSSRGDDALRDLRVADDPDADLALPQNTAYPWDQLGRLWFNGTWDDQLGPA